MDSQRQIVRKRNRPTLSCNHCRIRKSRCNRTKPCQSCVKSGDSQTCTYLSKESNDFNRPSTDQLGQSPLATRLNRLDDLISTFITEGVDSIGSSSINSNAPPTQLNDREDDCTKNSYEGKEILKLEQLTKAFGVMKVDRNLDTTFYLGQSHWVSIMSEIKEFRNYLITHHEDLENEAKKNKALIYPESENTTSLLRGIAPRITQEELRLQIPQRDVADELVTRFFTIFSNSLYILHEPTFREEYNEHWREPQRTKLSWLGLLYAVFYIAQLSYWQADDELSFDQVALQCMHIYRTRTVQCLIISNFTSPVKYTIETLLLYIDAEWRISKDLGIEVSLIIGMVIRLAMHMGIHRDPARYPDLTPFEGEMRRRIWTVIQLMDILYSFQISLPTSIRRSDSGSPLPRNIHDSEFGKDTKVLPPARPMTEVTEVSYTIVKFRMLVLMHSIMALVESKKELLPEDVISYEQALSDHRDMLPPRLRLNTNPDSVDNTMHLQRVRINLDRVYQTAQCMLHRTFLASARRDYSHAKYRGLCIDAAIILLKHQTVLYQFWKPTYPEIKKQHLLPAIATDFFIAGMAIALDLYYGFKYDPFAPSSLDVSTWGYDRRPEMIMALEAATKFWRPYTAISIETSKAYGMFSYVLGRAKESLAKIDLLTGTISDSIDNLNQTLTDFPSYDVELAGIENQPEMNWDTWNLYNGDGENFESFIQWPSMNLAAEPGGPS